MPRYIDADALRKKILNTRFAVCYDLPWNRWLFVEVKGTIEKILAIIKKTPSADVEEVRHGKWKHGREAGRTYIGDACVVIDYEDFSCSVCGYKINDRQYSKINYRYCPDCGAKMDGKENEND